MVVLVQEMVALGMRNEMVFVIVFFYLFNFLGNLLKKIHL